jgi:hypothetical protein
LKMAIAADLIAIASTSDTPSAGFGGVSIGVGPDQFAFYVTEDAYQGNAQFTISIDGQQQGGTLTATTPHGVPAQPVFVNGTFGNQVHRATVTFINDAYGGMPTADRNLYVDAATLEIGAQGGVPLTPASASLLSNGSSDFVHLGPAPSLTVGSGPDTLLFYVSEDAYMGNALFTVSVDGVQLGGDLEAVADHTYPALKQALFINSNFYDGAEHTVTVDFLNDAYGGSPATDRNLYVEARNIANQSITPATGNFFTTGSMDFIRPAQPDILKLALSEDAWQGDAQAEISIDGKVLGQVTVMAPNSGPAQTFDFTGSFGAGAHTVGVNFLNDAYGGTPDTDRNLFVKGVTLDGTDHPLAVANIYSGGLINLNI